MNAQNLDLTATTILKSLNLALYLNSKGRMKNKPLLMMKKPSIACYCPFTQGLCFFFKCKNITNNNSS